MFVHLSWFPVLLRGRQRSPESPSCLKSLGISQVLRGGTQVRIVLRNLVGMRLHDRLSSWRPESGIEVSVILNASCRASLQPSASCQVTVSWNASCCVSLQPSCVADGSV